MKTPFSDEFFKKLTLALKEADITAGKLSEEIGKPARFIEIAKRSGTIPELPVLMDICTKLGKDIHYFTNQESKEKKGLSSDIIFPSSYDAFANVLPDQELSDYLKNVYPIKIEFFLSGARKCIKFYKDFVFTRLYEKIIEAPEDPRKIEIIVHYPKIYAVEDVLSEKEYSIDEEVNNQLEEFYAEFYHDYSLFQKRLFHKYGLRFISKIKYVLNQIQLDYSEWDKMECGLIINDYAYLTNQNNYIITRQILNSEFLSMLNSKYENNIEKPADTDKSQQKQIKDIITTFENYHQGEISVSDLMKYLTNDENKKIIRELTSHLLIVGMPGTGKSTSIGIIKHMFFDTETEIEHSDDYINYKFFDDQNTLGKNDTRTCFKKKNKGNNLLYWKIREQLVLSTIYKAVGKNALLDLGAKEVNYDSVLFTLMDQKYTIVNLVLADNDKEQELDYYKKTYYQYLLDDKTRKNKIVNKADRSNLYNNAIDENGNLNLESDHFRKFIFDLCDKRLSRYQKRSNFTVCRTENDSPETVIFKIIYKLCLLKNKF